VEKESQKRRSVSANENESANESGRSLRSVWFLRCEIFVLNERNERSEWWRGRHQRVRSHDDGRWKR
jgi:hypothetical protein